jgi:tetratricopeptide (TPR) repeat protein
MDALKKAEEEKKKAAKRLEQVEANARADDSEDDYSERELDDSGEYVITDRLTETMKLSLEPLDAQGNQPPVPPIEVATVEAPESEALKKENEEQEDKEETSSLSINDIDISEDLTMENTVSQQAFEETQQAIDLNDTSIIEGLSTENASAPFDDTFHGVLFEGEEENSDVYEETLPGVPADQLVKDIGGDTYHSTPVAAQTVFSAGKGKPKSRYNWGIFIVLAILAFGSFGIFYYFTITPVARKLPSPIVARGIESLPVPGTALSQFEKSEVVSGTIISAQAEDPVIDVVEQTNAEEEIIPETQDDSVAKLENDINSEIVQETGQKEEAVDVVLAVPEISDVEVVASEQMVSAEAPLISTKDDKLAKQEAPAVDEPAKMFATADLEQMKISKKTVPLRQNAMISEAFKAYQSGQFESAERLYRNVLQDDPENRDIHLGLAAIAINKGDRESAYGHYLTLLDLNPDDAFALSALISLSNNSDPVKDESVIKTLIHKEGKIPYLYFALGNIYAKQLRWSAAQQAFFDAYSLDSTNPDYVLNLAISLDKIGQYASALDFYNVAIELAQHSAAGFNLSSVNDRIQVLNKVVEKLL